MYQFQFQWLGDMGERAAHALTVINAYFFFFFFLSIMLSTKINMPTNKKPNKKFSNKKKPQNTTHPYTECIQAEISQLKDTLVKYFIIIIRLTFLYLCQTL
jgi:hypothetical protein